MKKVRPAVVGAFVLGGVSLAVGGVAALGSKSLFRERYPFVSYFAQSVNGLREGAPVKFKGVEIGSVSEIKLPLANASEDPPVAVFFYLDGQKIRSSAEADFDADALSNAIESGLRVKLEQESYVTGLLYLAIGFVPDAQGVVYEPIPGVPEIPSAPNEFEQFAGQAKRFVDRLEQLDLASLVTDLQTVVHSIGELVESGQIQDTLGTLDESLTVLSETAAAIREEIGPLAASLRGASDDWQAAGSELRVALTEGRRTLQSIQDTASAIEQRTQELGRSLEETLLVARTIVDPSAPPLVRLEEALIDLASMARAARDVLELIEQDPAALVRGRSPMEEQR